MTDGNINRMYKDRLFKVLFEAPENRGELLLLYNALNHSDYTDETLLSINSIEDAIYMKMKNDVSFLISGRMTLFEQQSTYNPNMPFRNFEYCAKLYTQYVTTNNLNLYSSKRLTIPTPQCYVFYNGKDRDTDREILRLSDSFEIPTEGYEWTSYMINLNRGHNRELLEKCQLLKDYAEFVSCVKDYLLHYPLSSAIDLAVNGFIQRKDSFGQFLLKNRSEVMDMCITEYNEELHLASVREEGRELGLAAGLKQIVILLKQSGNSLDETYAKVKAMDGYEHTTKEQVLALYET